MYKKANCHLVFYNINYEYVSGIVTTDNPNNSNDTYTYITTRFTTPANCYYMSFSCSIFGDFDGVEPKIFEVNTYKKYASGEINLSQDANNKIKVSNPNLFATDAMYYKDRYISYSTGTIGVASNFTFTYIICKALTQYTINLPGAHICFFDNNFTFISGSVNQSIFTSPQNAEIMSVSVPIDKIDSIFIAEGTTALYSSYLSGPVYVNDKSSSATLVHVGPNELYHTITDAINDAYVENMTIIIHPGIYTESIKSWGKIINYIGLDRETCILQYSGADYKHPPIEMAQGSMQNMTIISMDYEGELSSMAAYCAHIDNNSQQGGTTYFDNVKFISYTNPCVGIGMRAHYNLIFNNCEFYYKHSRHSTNVIYCHSWESPNNTEQDRSEQNIFFTNNYIENNCNKAVFLFQSQEVGEMNCKILARNNIAINTNNPNNLIESRIWKDRPLAGDAHFMGLSEMYLDSRSCGNNIAELNAINI